MKHLVDDNINEQLQRLTAALNVMGNTVYEWNIDTGEISWSENAAEVLSIKDINLIDTNDKFLQLICEEDRENIKIYKESILDKTTKFEIDYRIKLADGNVGQIKDSGITVTDKTGKVEKIIGMLKVSEEDQESAFYNQFSSISKCFLQKLENIIQKYGSKRKSSVLMILSIRNYEMITMGYGHEEAEKILKSLREKILEILPEESIMERLQRNQFGIIIPDCSHSLEAEIALLISNRIQSFVKKYDKDPLHIVSSIGTVSIPEHATSAIEALNKVYIALDEAGNHNYCSYDNAVDPEKSRHQMELANYLRKAIDEKRLKLAYQPIVNSITGEVVHYECLLRFIGDDGALTSVGVLIPIAEQMGLIDTIDALVLDMVVEELRHHDNISLAFNVSNLTTENKDWFEMLKAHIEETPEIADRMIVEITETAAQDRLDKAAFFVASVQGLGCKVALDDFGSGYTSFQQLKTLSVDIIKIDGSFITNLAESSSDKLFVKTLMEFINGFDLEAIAECIETGEVAKILMDMGVHYMQGYFFGRPEATRETWE